MPRVHRAGGYDGEAYYNTRREAERHRFGGDEIPESVDTVDAAAECNRLSGELAEMERKLFRAQHLLRELVEVVPSEHLEGYAGRRAAEYVQAHPLPPATSADRDGGRSYGGG